VPVPETALAARARDPALAAVEQLEQEQIFVLIVDHGSDGNADLKILSHRPLAQPVLPVLSVLRRPLRTVSEIKEGPYAFVGDEHDVAAVSTVAAVGTSHRDVLFLAER
jgi:hypothetical protein